MTLVRLQNRSALLLTVITMFALLGTAARAENPAAHALVDRFAEADKAAAEKAKKKAQEVKNRAAAEARHKAEEAEMLERARREAAKRDDAVRKAEAALKEAQRIVREAEALRRAEEEEHLIEEARRKDESRRAKEAARAEVERLAKEAEERRQKVARQAELERTERERNARRAAEKAGEDRAEEDRLNALAAQREEEARHLSEKLKRIQQSRPPVGMALGGDPDNRHEAAAAQTPPEPSAHAQKKHKKLTSKVTVLLVMEPGTNGIRRGNKTADPVLCLKSGCYVSRGPARPAKWMPRRKALGPINTISRRAGTCRRSLVCVFRNVDLSKGAVVQPVDLRYVRHDRRAPTSIGPDATCDVDGEGLTCLQRAGAPGWHAWVVPEPIANKAGPRALRKALTRLSRPVVRAGLHNQMGQ